MRTEMAAEQREMLPGILDNIYYTWACGITEQSVRESIRRDLNSVSFKIYRKRNSQEIRGTASRADKTIATGGITSGESGYSPVMGGETVGAQVYTLRHS